MMSVDPIIRLLWGLCQRFDSDPLTIFWQQYGVNVGLLIGGQG